VAIPATPSDSSLELDSEFDSEFDMHELLQRTGGDRELLMEIAGLFLDDLPNMVEAIRSAVESGDASSLERSAHRLKGSIGNFGQGAAHRLAAHLEGCGTASDIVAAATALPELDEALKLFSLALEAVRRPST